MLEVATTPERLRFNRWVSHLLVRSKVKIFLRIQPPQEFGRQNHSRLNCSLSLTVSESDPVSMTNGCIKLFAKFARAMAIVGLMGMSFGISAAQSAQQSTPVIPVDKDKIESDSPASMEEEMRAKRAIKVAEKEYQQNVDRARDLSELGTSVNTSFKQKTYLGKDDLKKLEKAEKLAKAIRNAAGGSDDNEMEQPPKDLGCALSMFAEVAESLKKNVEKTPKHVVSTTVIDQANVLLELTRIVRALVSSL